MNIIIKISFLFLISLSLSAQNGQIKFKHISTEDGLSNLSVSFITQDSMGFMWIGTVDGLCKYDGYKFTTYRNDPENPKSLSNNEIWVIFEDSNKNLWIGTRGGGLNKYIRETDSFITYKYDENDPNSLSHNIIRAIYEDNDNRLWIGTRAGLNLFDREKNNFTRLLYDENDANSLSNNYVISICEDSKGNFWIATHGGGLNLFNRKTEKFTHYKFDPHDKNSINDNFLWHISEDNEGYLWVPTNSGLDRIDLNNEQVIFEHYIHNDSIPQSLSEKAIGIVYTDDLNRVWVGTNSGLDLFDRENNAFIHFKQGLFDTSLSDNQIWSIYQDRSGLLWVGTHWGGINIFDTHYNSFKHFEYVKGNSAGLLEKSILAFYEDKDSEVWIGVDHGGLNLFNKEKNTFRHFIHEPENPNSLSSNAVLSFGEDSYGYLWVGTWGGGVNRFDRKGQKFKRYLFYANDPGSSCDQNIYAIFEDSRKNLWIGTHDCGLHFYNRIEDSFTPFYLDNTDTTALSSDRVWVIFEDNKENLWVGTIDGLNLFDRDNKKFKIFKNKKDDPYSLPNNTVQTIFEDSKERLWFGTPGGLSLYDYKKQSFKTYNTKDGLPSDMVGNILEDAKGNLWIGTFNGLSKFNPDTETIQNYGKQDGLLNNHINLRSSLKGSNGEMYFGSPNGFIKFYPEDIQTNEHIPSIVITNFQLFNKSVEIGADSPLKKHITITKEIILTHRDYVFSFEFSALDYVSPKNNRYKYILENFDKNWNYKSAEDRTATYTNLSPGEYVFKVQGSNNDGTWNNEGASVRIIVLPPWWHTWWARIGYVIAGIFLLISFVKFRTRSIERQKRTLGSRVVERTATVVAQKEEIESTFKELQQTQTQLVESEKMASLGVLTAGIAHEINNPINFISVGVNNLDRDFKDLITIINVCKDIPEEGEQLIEKAKVMNELKEKHYFDDILRTIPQTIEDINEGVKRTNIIIRGLMLYSRSEDEQLQRADVHESIDSALLLLTDKHKHKIEIIKNYKSHIKKINCFPGQLNQVFVNLLDNAMDSIDNKGTISIDTQSKNGELIISIRDTGKGIPEDIIAKIFDPFFSTKTEGKGTGLGLSICQGIIKKHKGRIEVESEAGKGTEFVMKIPTNIK